MPHGTIGNSEARRGTPEQRLRIGRPLADHAWPAQQGIEVRLLFEPRELLQFAVQLDQPRREPAIQGGLGGLRCRIGSEPQGGIELATAELRGQRLANRGLQGAEFLGQPQPDVAAAISIVLLASLVMLALSIPLLMGVWFAAPLVMLHDGRPVDAFKASFFGCLKNVVPFLVYGVIAFFAAIIATLPILLGWLVLGPVIMGSMYAGYRDIFTEAGPA